MHLNGRLRIRRRSISTIALTALVAAMPLVQAPPAARAADPTAEIRAKERSDPAAGEIIILNRKKVMTDKPGPAEEDEADTRAKNKAAPDPYAPRRPEARTVETPPERPAGRTTSVIPDAAPLPPPPSLNRQARPRQWARTGDNRGAIAREQVRRPPTVFEEERGRRGDYRADRWREAPREWDRGPRYPRDWREAPARTFADRRPWRACRRLARLCEDGFERACWSWQRRC